MVATVALEVGAAYRLRLVQALAGQEIRLQRRLLKGIMAATVYFNQVRL
jgi:hypothetical protein